MTHKNAVIYGCKGESLSQEEQDFFSSANPYGIILFQRNCSNKKQLSTLIHQLKEVTNQDNLPILIDQEGGRVARLQPPEWNRYNPGMYFADIARNRNLDEAKKLVFDQHAALARELRENGVTVNCSPVADLFFEYAHEVIGDRAFGETPEMVAALAGEVCRSYKENGITPIIKHIPGHGRATLDSHHDLPVVETPLEELEKTDFKTFSLLKKHANWAMTAHIIYTALDPDNPATTSSKVIDYIRQEIGFEGILLTDDLSMKALKGSFEEKTQACLDAGCDIILHCNGELKEMQAIQSVITPLSENSLKIL